MPDQPPPDTAPALLPWGPGTATGVGSMPGDDPLAAARFVVDELPDLPHLPELPARGPGADLIGRAATLLTDCHVDLQPSGWRLVGRPGVDERRARDLLARDLDALEAAAEGYAGPLKLQVAGPITLARGLQLTRGEPALADPGALRDLAGALADGLAGHLADVAKRLPGARLLVQVDEPSLPAVLRGEVRSVSGFATLRPVPAADAEDRLRAVLDAVTAAGGWPLVHCCAGDPPVELAVAAGARGVSVDAAQLTGRAALDTVGAAVERGAALFLGVVPSLGPGVPLRAGAVADTARRLWRDLGFAAERLPEQVVVTPACGLAGASPGWLHSAYRLLRQVGHALAEAPEVRR